jgi:hypothetical protein
VAVSFPSLWQIPEINNLPRRKGLFWLILGMVSVHSGLALLFWGLQGDRTAGWEVFGDVRPPHGGQEAKGEREVLGSQIPFKGTLNSLLVSPTSLKVLSTDFQQCKKPETEPRSHELLEDHKPRSSLQQSSNPIFVRNSRARCSLCTSASSSEPLMWLAPFLWGQCRDLNYLCASIAVFLCYCNRSLEMG